MPELFTDGKTPEEAGRDDAREAMSARSGSFVANALSLRLPVFPANAGAAGENRTHDLSLTKGIELCVTVDLSWLFLRQQ